jgi:formylmethanofuran dehydrogenase subunit E-like metal-binding protein
MVDSSNGYVKYGKSDLLTLSSRNTNSEYIAFFKRGGSLFVALYDNSGNLVYVKNVSLKTSAGLWRELHDAIGEGDACVCSFTVSSWANGVSGNVLYPACVSGENIIQTLKYNPPKKESGLPLEDTPYDVLGVPGITDDAFIWSDDDPGKLACISDIMVKESVTQSVRWTGASQTGMSIEMSYESKPKEMFRERTDLNPEASANNGSEYRKLSNPTSANDVLAESEGSAQVLGVAGNEDALSYESAYETDNSKELEITTPQQIRQIGVEAGEKAVAYFKSKGIDIRSSSDDLYLLTSAGHVKINGMDTWIAFDGLEEGLGFKLSEKSLLPLHTSLWKDLVFYFFWIDSTSKDILSYGLKYCPDENELAEVDSSAQLDEYAGYILGLYDEHSHGNEPYCGGYKQRYWDVTVDSDVLPLNLIANHSAVNKTLNSTKPVNKSDNASNVTQGANFDNVTKRPGERQDGSNPHNIFYTLGSIVLVCAIFFTGYSKP